jgi:nucleoside-diphosphate-sugar epimerase
MRYSRQAIVNELNGFSLAINTAIIQVPEINDQKKLGYEVNVLGLQNLCDAVESIDSLKGLLHISSWHVFGERDLAGTLNEEFGSRPDKIDERARLYALCKIAQETIIRIVEAGSTKFYGTIRVGTILGEGLPRQTAANLFIESALHDRPLTPFRHTQYRPMLYVDIGDVCETFGILASKALAHDSAKDEASKKQQTINLMWPRPITIIELARMIQRITTRLTGGLKHPEIKVVDTGSPPLFSPKDKARFSGRHQ